MNVTRPGSGKNTRDLSDEGGASRRRTLPIPGGKGGHAGGRLIGAVIVLAALFLGGTPGGGNDAGGHVTSFRPQRSGAGPERDSRLTSARSNGRRAAAVRTPTVRELVGQRFVVAVEGRTPSRALIERVRRGEIGGVILFGGNVVDPSQLRRLTTTLQHAARDAHRPPLIIAADQEGGSVRRVRWAGPVDPVPALGRHGEARVRSEAAAAGAALRAMGINVDLAPVVDVPVPGSFMAAEQRVFAFSAPLVAGAGVAFVKGLADARVAATAKHFPGIGRATTNTDRTAVQLPAPRATIRGVDLVPFVAAIRAGVPLVMISNADYPRLDDKPAPWSPAIQGLLRRELGFRGVTISDALDAAATTRSRTLPSVSVLAAQAGVDLLLLTGSEASTAAAYERVAAVAVGGGIARSSLRRSYDRILALKRAYG